MILQLGNQRAQSRKSPSIQGLMADVKQENNVYKQWRYL
jgi:hypothetical protein